MKEPWLTKPEIARELKVSVRTVERLRLPAMRVGGQNRYRLSEAEDFMRNAHARACDRGHEQFAIANNVVEFPRPRVPA